MKMITGFLKPESGFVEICGIDMLTNPIGAQRHIGYLPEGAPAYTDISTNTYLNFIADIRRLSAQSRRSALDYVVDRTNLSEGVASTHWNVVQRLQAAGRTRSSPVA